MRKNINGTEYEVPKGFVFVGTPMIELIDIGDIALFRDGDQRPVEFVAAMPDDMSEDYPNIIAVKGYEPWSCTNDLRFDTFKESEQDIIGILKCRSGGLLMGSNSQTHYTVMLCDDDGKPKSFIDLNGFEYQDPEDGDIHYHTTVTEANHLRQRIADAMLRQFEDMIVVEVVKEIKVYPVAVEAIAPLEVTPTAHPLQKGSVIELNDGSVVEVLGVRLSDAPTDNYRLAVTYIYGGEKVECWYDREGYTNHVLNLHIRRIHLY